MDQSKHRPDPFFVGYVSALPDGLKSFLTIVILALLGGFAGIAFAIATSQDNPGDGRFRFDLGYQTMTGIIEAGPYPLLRLPPSDDHPDGRTVLLSGGGKRGVQARAAPLDGQFADAGGIWIRRGDIDMLQVGGKVGLRASEIDAPAFDPSAPVDLGRWQLTGEICDGKCYLGAMRPGRGLAHKACANVCLNEGIPPVFVTTAPVDGRMFFLLADSDGAPLTERILPHVAQMVRIDGAVERRGDLHVFKADLATLELLQ
ncbi:MAG: hypothetical protein AAGF59_12655 [Pseudomonadota bacterium]